MCDVLPSRLWSTGVGVTNAANCIAAGIGVLSAGYLKSDFGLNGVLGGQAVTVTAGQVVITNGAGAFTRTGIAVTPSLAQEVISTPSNFYFNVHSTLNGTGFARGQLSKS